MFLDLEKQDLNKIAIVDSSGDKISYGDLLSDSESFGAAVGHRSLIFVLNDNSVGAALGYISAMMNRVVPLMLSATLDEQFLHELVEKYHPAYIWKPTEKLEVQEKIIYEKHSFVLVGTNLSNYEMYDELALLLTTSGSTGSPKLVRHSYCNIEAQARNISAFFELDSTERAMLDLPINYTYGLSILNSHLYVGATVLITGLNVFTPEYWNFFKEYEATSFTNVPYGYEILNKIGFFRRDFPELRTLSQGGGKLSEALHRKCAEYAVQNGKRFIVTYGQTEGSARMAYLPACDAMRKIGSIGKAIPGGTISIIDDDGKTINEAGVIGEMIYAGPNVTLGYAECGQDLVKEDERNGVLPTGDLVKMDEEGYIYIVGRKKRFLKLWGYRMSLDECENLIRDRFEVECACTGDDNAMRVYVTNDGMENDVKQYLSARTGINSSAFQVSYIEKIPRNEAGKILYGRL